MKKPFLRRFTKRILILINVALGLMFLIGANVKYFNPDHWWFLSLCTFILPYLLIILFAFFLFWLLAKPLYSLIFILIIIFSLNAIENIFAFRMSSFSMEKSPNSIRVMSWNVEFFNILNHKTHPEKKQEMFDLIRQYDPDIACFQEVVASDKIGAINYLPDILETLQFSEYAYSYHIKNNFDREHHFGILILSKYPILRKQTVVNNPNDYNSTFQFVDILVNNDTLRVFNAHLQSLKFSQDNRDYLDKGAPTKEQNIKESKSILAKLKKGIIRRASQAFFIKDEINQSPYPIIFCGDFNDVPVSYAYEKIGMGLQNAFVKKGSGIGKTFNSIAPTLRIDNIFVGPEFNVLQFDVNDASLSDHFPIIADIKMDSISANNSSK